MEERRTKPNPVDLGGLTVLTGEAENGKTLFILLGAYEENLIMFMISNVLSVYADIGVGFQWLYMSLWIWARIIWPVVFKYSYLRMGMFLNMVINTKMIQRSTWIFPLAACLAIHASITWISPQKFGTRTQQLPCSQYMSSLFVKCKQYDNGTKVASLTSRQVLATGYISSWNHNLVIFPPDAR